MNRFSAFKPVTPRDQAPVVSVLTSSEDSLGITRSDEEMSQSSDSTKAAGSVAVPKLVLTRDRATLDITSTSKPAESPRKRKVQIIDMSGRSASPGRPSSPVSLYAPSSPTASSASTASPPRRRNSAANSPTSRPRSESIEKHMILQAIEQQNGGDYVDYLLNGPVVNVKERRMLYRSMRSQSISTVAEQGSESPTRSVYDAEDAYEMTPRTTDSTGSGESDSGSVPSSMDSSQSNSFSFGNNNNSVLSGRSHERIAIALNSPLPQRVNRNKNQIQDREQMLSSVLRRSNSVPFLNSWEFGNIDIDLHLPFVGSVYDYLSDIWERKEVEIHRRFSIAVSRPQPTSAPSSASDLGDAIGIDDAVDALRSPSKAHLTNSKAQLTVSDLYGEKVIAGTKQQLLEMLTDNNVDSEYLDVFIATHKSWIKSLELLKFLINVFYNPTPRVLTSDNTLAQEEKLIQLRVINVMKKWLRMFFYDFTHKELNLEMNEFIKKLKEGEALPPDAPSWAQFLINAYRAARKKEDDMKEETTSDDPDAPNSYTPKVRDMTKLNFVDLNPREVARQLSLIHFKMFAKIRRQHIFDSAVHNKFGPENPLTEISQFSQRMSNWVATEILMTPHVKKQRTITINHFITILMKLLEMNNYHGAMEIFVGLQNPNVERLKRSWLAVDRKLLDKYKEVTELMNPVRSWGNLRRQIEESTPPFLVPPAIWLRDLLGIMEGNPSYLDDSGVDKDQKTLNFDKLRLTATVYKRLSDCQFANYKFVPVKIVQDYLMKTMVLSEQEIEAAAANAKQYEGLASSSSSSSYNISFSPASIKKAAEKAKEKAMLKAEKLKKKMEKLGSDASPRRLLRSSISAGDKEARVDKKKRSLSFEKSKPK